MTDGLDPLPHPAGRGPLAPSVSADLCAIFADAGEAAPATATPSKVRAVTGRGRGRVHYTTVGAIAAAGLLGLTVGAAVLRPQTAAPAAANPAPQRILPVEVVTAAPTVTLHPDTRGPIGLADNEPVTMAQAPVAIRRGGKLVTAVHRHANHSDLMAADRRLRAAYSRAVGAGVSRRVLVNYRDRWEDLREDATWKPDRVAAGYGAMTNDLDRLARRNHGRRPAHAHHARSLFGLFS
jgi:hypothetical protein